MAQDNATVNLYINNEQAVGAIEELRGSWNALRKARKEAEASGNAAAALELAAEEKLAHQKYKVAKNLKYDIDKVLASASTVSMDHLYAARKQLSSQVKILSRDTDEYKEKLKQLSRIEKEIASSSTRRLGMKERLKQGASQLLPVMGVAGAIATALSAVKQFGSEIFTLSKTIQGESKRAAIVFGDELGRVEMQAGKLAAKAGLTTREMVSMASATADLLIPLGFARDVSADMSIKVQTLTGALDEWTAGKFGADEISRRLTKAMLGETETLKELGIAVRLDSEEYKNLIKQKLADGAASTGQAQAMAILDMLYQKSADAQAAYASGGNELLRFQKSATLGWKQMKESVAEWFAFTSQERVEKQARSFRALDEEFQKNEASIESLLPVYESLSTKTNLNAAEQQQLRDTINGIVGIVPYAAVGFDQYNQALAVNTTTVKSAMEAERLYRQMMMDDTINDQIDVAINQIAKVNSAMYHLDIATKTLSDRRLDGSRTSARARLADDKLNIQVWAMRDALKQEEIALGKCYTALHGFGLLNEEISERLEDGSFWVDVGVQDIERYTAVYSNFVALRDKKPAPPVVEEGLIPQIEKKIKTAKDELSKLTAEADIVAKNSEINKLEAELKRLQALGNASTGGTTPKQYSLSADKEYLKQKLALQQQLQSGEILSEQEHAQKLLALEVSMLEARIASGKSSGEDLLKLNQELAEKRYAQKKAEADYNKKLQEAKYEGEPAIAAENRAYENRLKDLGLFGRKREELNQAQLDALQNQERIHNAKLSSLRLTIISDGITNQQKAVDRKSTALRVAANDELASADTFEKKKLLLSRWFSAEELRVVTKDKEADRLLKGKYKEEEEAATKEELRKLISYYESFTREISVMNPFGALIDAAMTDEDRKKLEDIIADLKDQLSKLGAEPSTTSGGGANIAKTDILGFTAEQWSDTFSNLKEGKNGLAEWQMILQGVGNAFGEVANLMSAVEQRNFKEFTKTQNKKKQSLDRQLKSGVISQEQYNSNVQQIEAETEAKREEMERKRAVREKMMSIFQALINTAVGVTSALRQNPPDVVLASIIGALGAIQVATILATPVPGAEDGGYINVEREQDGKHFRAKNDPSKRGVVSSPTVIVGEGGAEYVVPNDGYRNPTIRPVLDIIEMARRSGSLNSINLPEVMRGSFKGRQGGGYIADTPAAVPSSEYSDDKLPRAVERLIAAAEALDRAADTYTSRRPRADVVIAGRGGFAEKYDKYKRIIDKSHM